MPSWPLKYAQFVSLGLDCNQLPLVEEVEPLGFGLSSSVDNEEHL